MHRNHKPIDNCPPVQSWERGRENSLRECKTELENMLLKYSDYCIFFLSRNELHVTMTSRLF